MRFKSGRTAENDNMAGVCLLAFIAGLLLEVNGLPADIPEENTGNRQKEQVWTEERSKGGPMSDPNV